MLQELHITNFAIIDDVHLKFTKGFNIITGETGAGKSILIDAVNTALGAQADRDFVRSGAEKATVEVSFGVPPVLQTQLQTMLEDDEIDFSEPDEILLSREIKARGRSVARINGTIVKLSTYREVGAMLVDIHGQSDNLSLLKPRLHIYLLDRFADLEESRATLTTLVKRLQQIRHEIEGLQQDEAALERRIEILEYQIQEIETAHLRPGEDEELKAESNRLANSERLLEFTTEVERLLNGDDLGEVGAVDLLGEAALILSRITPLDPSINDLAELAETVSVQVEELAEGMRRYGERIDLTPGQLDKIEERLALLSNLKRKYGGSIEAVLGFLERARRELDGITHSEERLEELQAQEDDLLYQIGGLAANLSQRRQKAAQKLARMVEEQLKDLRMEAARFEVRIEQHPDEGGCYVNDQRLAFDATGVDDVEFMLATNFGEPIKPLAKVASGGETSRSMLALKQVLSQADQTPTLIFDEIDSGIGGRLGAVIGQKLWRLADGHQVLCITHLAQLASFADVHFRVRKKVVGKRTITEVDQLDGNGRLAELAEMLGAETDSARQSAHELLEMARQIKDGQRVGQL